MKPPNAMNEDFRRIVSSLLSLMQSLPRLVNESGYQDIDNEWRKLPDCELPAHMTISENIDMFWHNLYHCDDHD